MVNNNLLVLRNATALKNTQAFFLSNNVDAFYQEISNSESLSLDLTGVKTDIILVTSQNALETLENNINKICFKKIYCLNKHIAKKVKVNNMVDLAWNNTKELADYIVKNEEPGQEILHLCADNANKLFYTKLKQAGFKVKEQNAYKTYFVETFSAQTLDALKQKQIKYVMLFSKASIKAAEEIFAKYNLNIIDYKLICFSKRIAEGYSNLYAEHSTLEEMLKIYEGENNG